MEGIGQLAASKTKIPLSASDDADDDYRGVLVTVRLPVCPDSRSRKRGQRLDVSECWVKDDEEAEEIGRPGEEPCRRDEGGQVMVEIDRSGDERREKIVEFVESGRSGCARKCDGVSWMYRKGASTAGR